MKKIALFLSLIFITSCGGKPVPNMGGKVLKAEVSHYSDVAYRTKLLEKKTTLNFIVPSKDDLKVHALSSTVIQHCSDAALKKGYPIMIDSKTCADCLDVTVKNSTDTEEKNSSFANCFTDKNPNQSNCFGDQVKKYGRWIQLTITDPKTQKQVHKIEVSSDGPSDSITKVAKEMCHAAFIDFPDNVIKKNYTVPYPMQ